MLKPKVEAVQPEPHIAWKINSSVLTVGSGEDAIAVDLEERQTDSETVIDICRCEGGLMEGACGSYVLSVQIPPRKYHEEAGEESPECGTGIILVPEPLDIASVILRLWTEESMATFDNEEEI